MLILQRRVGERIVLSGGIEITVTAVTKRGVRLAVNAPRGVTVVRGEVHDAIVAANANASESNGALIDVDIFDVPSTKGEEP